ncbi:MAG: endo alpha-1,4 polygalactosaminidase [Bacteroidota bacterium]
MKNLIVYFLSLAFLLFSGCNKKKDLKGVDFRAEMVNFVHGISTYAKSADPEFLIIPQNGEQLVDDELYLGCIDGIGREDLSYGYDHDGEATSSSDRGEILPFIDKVAAAGKVVLVTDYVFSDSEDNPHYDYSTQEKINNAYQFSTGRGYIPYATVRNLNYLTINPGHEPDVDSIVTIADVKSFLYYLQPAGSVSKDKFIQDISLTNYDIVIMDMTYDGLDEFSAQQIQDIRSGLNGGKGGYVLAYMSIGEAEDYRFYWDEAWTKRNGNPSADAPEWLYKENPDWEGNYKVLYWKDEWKNIIFGNEDAYLDKIMKKGYDGVYLDIIDGFEYFEDIMGE